MNKKVAVILVNWNSFQYSFDCISSLREMQYRDFDIILVDNDSADHSGDKLKQHFQDILFIDSPKNLGFTGGNNLGMQYAIEQEYPYVLLLNNDTLVTANFLEQLTGFMDANPQIGATQPKIYFEHDRSAIWSSGGYYVKSIGMTFTSRRDQPEPEGYSRPVDWISGCAFFCRTAALQKTGLFAQNMFMYYEDVDLSFRIKQLGYTISYYPGAVIYHIAGASGKQKEKGKEGFVSAAIHYYNVRNRIWIAKKYTPFAWVPTVILFNFFYIVILMAYFVCRFRFHKLATVLKAAKDGINGKIIYN